VINTYDLVIVGGGLSSLSFLRAGGAAGRSLVVEYQDQLGGFLRHALPAPGFEPAWYLMTSFESGDGSDVGSQLLD
jgi:hypothetical protein